jgi:hypothetical protein
MLLYIKVVVKSVKYKKDNNRKCLIQIQSIR